ncbi:MAG TPA: Fic family protein [Ktedonobacterales bacterium]|nr:Fic family protein [Ktedonobacterales bacterium]
MPPGRPSRAAIHARLEEQVAELRARYGGLPSPEEAEGIWTDIWYQEAHHSTAIEGNTLVRRQVELLLKEGRLTGDKELREYLEVQGYADAAKWVYGQALAPGDWSSGALVSLPEVRHIHELMIGPAWKVAPHPLASDQEGPGQWRRHDIEPFGGGMEPPSWTEIQALMTDWTESVGELRSDPSVRLLNMDGGELRLPDKAPFAQRVARLHAAFERIHPFLDGNGRTGRLLTNLILIRLGYPPVIIQKRERSFYLAALDRADRGEPEQLGELFARAILDNLNRFILPAVAGPAKLVPLEALATTELKVASLRKAAERGTLRATRAPNGTWRSSRVWVDEYVARRWSRARKPESAVAAAQ